MKVTYETMLRRRCPVNDDYDTYVVLVESNTTVPVERLLEALAALPEKEFQETLTQQLADVLGRKITTVGYHSGVKTTCVC